MRRWILIAILLVLAVTLTFAVATAAGSSERLTNGNFEEGFGTNGVASGWIGFNNGGAADYIYRDDTGPRFAVDGKHSQFIRISTMAYFISDPDRYAGIYQTVPVVAGTAYTLSMSGMLRVLPDDLDKNNFSYVVQWAMDPNGGTDWGKVKWNDVPWGTTYNEDDSGVMSKFTTSFTALSNKVTVFIRALKKWPTRYRTLFVNLDGVSLSGAAPAVTESTVPSLDLSLPKFVYTTKPFHILVSAADPNGISQISLTEEGAPVASSTHAVGPATKDVDFVWTPMTPGVRHLTIEVVNGAGTSNSTTRSITVAPIKEFLKNGDFEGGFTTQGVALQWHAFDNGGEDVVHQLYDDSWKPVLGKGSHSQLVEINTLPFDEGDPNGESDRYAGICQVVTGLTPGATYYLTANGLIRITEGDRHTDDWSWAARWGYYPVASPDCSAWSNVTNWDVFPWPHADYRESPTKLNTYTTVFTAPNDTITVFMSAWKKWAIGRREFLVNFDDLSLAGYQAP